MNNSGHILIATHHLKEFAGSEITALELAIEFQRRGWEVQVACFLLGEPMLSIFKRHGFKVFNLIEDLSFILSRSYDLVWIQHAPVYYQLCLANRIRTKKIVHSCLSPFEPIEVVPSESGYINWILANSDETKKRIESELEGGDRVQIFPNSVPSEFWQHAKTSYPDVPKKIAVVSNHPPDELFEAANILAKRRIKLKFIGSGSEFELVTPELLAKFDAVVSIGKTVQYCFALKIPVYCYDHFGGPGWISEKNFNDCFQRNFSGRGFSRKKAELIASDLSEGYKKSLGETGFLHLQAKVKFDLLANLQALLEKPQKNLPSYSPHPERLKLILKQHECYMRLLGLMKSTDGINLKLENCLQEIRSSWTWKISAPFRYVERAMRRLGS